MFHIGKNIAKANTNKNAAIIMVKSGSIADDKPSIFKSTDVSYCSATFANANSHNTSKIIDRKYFITDGPVIDACAEIIGFREHQQ